MLQKLTCTLRFDVTGERREHWLVTVRKGEVAVSRSKAKADCSVLADRGVMNAVTKGEVNALAATLRGTVIVEGDLALLVGFQRLFPGPPSAKATPMAAGQAKGRS
ncbi:MAG TPA: SCP2 sterol-binding domain-containing protein [Gaiellales bacterium]|nr:SCP2 sterol-binding domain-containing protein [Gaiellales bacterium]